METIELYEWYFGLIEKALAEITFWNPDEMPDKWSKNLYADLLEKRSNSEDFFL